MGLLTKHFRCFNKPIFNFHLYYSDSKMEAQSNLRVAYRVLEDRVNTALRTQLGDAERLAGTRGEALTLIEAFEQASKFSATTLS